MHNETVLINDLYFPKRDENLGKIRKDILLTAEVGPRYVSTFCKKKNVVVQAGGNYGIYPKIYSEIFETVYTFEPDPINFYCLTRNVTNLNVIKFQSCLGASHELVSIDINKNSIAKKGFNSGTFQVSGKGKIPTLTIDDLGLTTCDLIHLDIEGFEGIALQGAIETIKKCKPAICLEINGLGKNYGWDESKIYNLLLSLNYKFEIKTESDHLFLPL
jgi:FkbM family methyltransferase